MYSLKNWKGEFDMDNFDTKIRKEINGFLERNIQFTHKEKAQLQRKINQKEKKSLKFNPIYWIVLVSAASLFIFLSSSLVGNMNNDTSNGNSTLPGFVGDQNEEVYQGEKLSIGVLGTEPKIREEQINFHEITFEQFTIEEVRKYNAIFIMEESLSTAAEKQFTSIFTDSNIPFFFINSNKGEYPFIDEELEYEEAREIPYHDYFATGYLSTIEGSELTWTYESDTENNQDAFSNIFSTIENNFSQGFQK